ncbi:MAG TPA: hypothetical protein VF980_05540 [Thermoanaerobaculia bacterium]
MRLALSLALAAFPSLAFADALTDLRTTLAQLAATTPVRGALDVTSTIHTSEDDRPDTGRASVQFESGGDGLRLIYSPSLLAEAGVEARREAVDPDQPSPVRSGLRRVNPLHLAELVDAAAALNVALQNAQLVEAKSSTYRGRPARVVTVRVTPKLTKAANKHVRKIERTLSIWVGDDGVPVAAEESLYAKASFLLITFENAQKESWSFTRTGDRLIATRHDQHQKAGGLGQHEASETTEVIRLE